MNIANTGELSTYTFQIERLAGLTEGINDLYVQFPDDHYVEKIGKNIKCSVRNNQVSHKILTNRRLKIENIGSYYLE